MKTYILFKTKTVASESYAFYRLMIASICRAFQVELFYGNRDIFNKNVSKNKKGPICITKTAKIKTQENTNTNHKKWNVQGMFMHYVR